MSVGNRLRHLRSLSGKTQGELAKQLYVTASSIGMYESEKPSLYIHNFGNIGQIGRNKFEYSGIGCPHVAHIRKKEASNLLFFSFIRTFFLPNIENKPKLHILRSKPFKISRHINTL